MDSMAFLVAGSGRAAVGRAAGGTSASVRLCTRRPAAGAPVAPPLTMKAKGGGGKKKKGKAAAASSAKAPAAVPAVPPTAAAGVASAAAAAAAATEVPVPSPPPTEAVVKSVEVVDGEPADGAAAAAAADPPRIIVPDGAAVEAPPVVVDRQLVGRLRALVEKSAARAAAAAAADAAAGATAESFAADPSLALDDDIPDTPPPPPLPTVSADEAASLRWALDSTIEERLAALRGLEAGDPLERSVVANRHLLGQRFFVALTSRVLAAESAGDAAAAAVLRSTRDAVVAITWRVDQPFHAAVLAAESRLMAVVADANPDRATNGRAVGTSADDVAAFWTVLYASVTAWEERGRVAPELVNVDVQGALRTVVDRLRGRAAAMAVLRPEMGWLGDFFVADPDAQQEMVAALGDEDDGGRGEAVLVGLGTLVNQLHLFPVNAYGGLLERLITVYDFAIREVYGNDTRVETTRFKPEPLRFESQLVKFIDASR